MYTLLERAGLFRGTAVEAPALAVSLVIAEVFYKFHSFTLECVAFLTTWLAVSTVAVFLTKWLSPKLARPAKVEIEPESASSHL